ncbi:CBS domain-containing protein [Alteromonadaceae bacterium BrNp21-10]|nr:CBS domain-containing protein [Alteromonadaceae bacterium BrNp21-10]
MNSSKLKLAVQFLHDEPQAAALKLELETPELAAAMLLKVPNKVAANVMCCMQPLFAASMMSVLDEANIAGLLDSIDSAHTAAILRHLPTSEFARVLGLLPLKKQTLCKMLISYPDYTVGAWVETNVLILDSQMTIEDALLRLKKRRYSDETSIYVVNHQRQVVGKMSVFDVIRRPATQIVEDVMSTQVDVIGGYTELLAALELPIWSVLDCVAVINRKQEFIGIIHHHRLRTILQLHSTPVVANKQYLSATLFDAYAATLARFFDLASTK